MGSITHPITRPILSVCIPTYNGATSSLNEVLETVAEIMKSFTEIEVVVGDNCSTDGTSQLVSSYLNKGVDIRYFRNETNIGFNGNMKLLMDNYAEGEYLWMIGDDDIININSIPFLLDILNKRKIDYLSLRYQYIKPEDYKNLMKNKDFSIHFATFAETIDTNCRRGNSFGTFMGSAIVRREIFNSVPKEHIENKFDLFYNVWPNAYINATAFHDKVCGYIPEVAIYCIEHVKGWALGDNVFKLTTECNVQMLDYFISLGIKQKDLRNTEIRVLYDYLFNSLQKPFLKKRVGKDFSKYLIRSFKYPIIAKTIFINFCKMFRHKVFRTPYKPIDVD